MAITTALRKLSAFGGSKKVITTTTKLGSRAKDVLSGLTGKRTSVAVSKASSVVADTSKDASKARKILTPQTVNKEAIPFRGAAAKAVKGAGYGALVAIPLAAGGYGVGKLGQAIGEVRQGFAGASPEDLAASRLSIIQDIVDQGGNPADYGFTEQNLPDRKDGADSPMYVFSNQQPSTAIGKPSVGDEITKVALVGGAVAGGLMLVNHLLKKKKGK